MSPKVGSPAYKTGLLAREATHAARKRLTEIHHDEYLDLIAEERRDRGLPAERTADTIERLRERIAELEAMT